MVLIITYQMILPFKLIWQQLPMPVKMLWPVRWFVLLSTATAANYSSVEWATSGDGTFNDISLLNAEYTPGISDISAGTVTLTFTHQVTYHAVR